MNGQPADGKCQYDDNNHTGDAALSLPKNTNTEIYIRGKQEIRKYEYPELARYIHRDRDRDRSGGI